jgi:hypothetical protein
LEITPIALRFTDGLLGVSATCQSARLCFATKVFPRTAPSAKWHIREEFPDSTPERLTGAERTLLARGGLCAASSGRSLAVPQSVPLLQSFPALRVPMTG